MKGSIAFFVKMVNCLVITAIICVLVTTVGTIVSFATPNWLSVRVPAGLSNKRVDVCDCSSTDCDCGLWLNCRGGPSSAGSLNNCQWYFANEFAIEKNLPDWFKAVQGLMSCAVASSMLSLLIGLFSLCWSSKGCNPYQATGAFANLTFLLLAVAISLFGAKAYLENKAEVLTDKSRDTDHILLFGWSFWVAVGSTALSLIASILYFCVGRNEEEYN